MGDGQNTANLIGTGLVHPFQRGGGGVPTSRAISAVAPYLQVNGGTSGTLIADISLSAVVTGAGSYLVGSGRTIATTAPLTGGGDFTANRTFAMTPFDATHDGYVVKNPSGAQGKFLRDDGTFQTGAVAGVTSIAGVGPILVAPNVGDVFINIALANITDYGAVPPTGGANSLKFLCATNPITWAIPGIGNFVQIQASLPGVTDVGHAHISGIFAGETGLVGGYGQSLGLGIIESITSSDSLYSYFARRANTSFGPLLVQQRARGSIASPTASQDNDELGGFVATGYGSSYSGSLGSGLTVRADGNGSTRQPAYMNLITGDLTSIFHGRFSSMGARFEAQLGSAPGNSIRALHTVDVQGTFGIKPKILTVPVGGGVYNYTQLATDPSILLVDATGQDCQISLLTAVGKAGRRFTAISMADGHVFSLAANGGELINGVSSIFLRNKGDSITIVSDGANWWTESRPIQVDRQTNLSAAAAVANTAAESNLSAVFGFDTELEVGSVIKVRAGGKYSTTGTPTLRIKLLNSAFNAMLDSGAITCSSGVTDRAWYVECEVIMDNISTYAGKILRGVLSLENGSGIFTQYQMFTNFSNPPGGVLPIRFKAQWGAADPANTITNTALVVGISPHTIQI